LGPWDNDMSFEPWPVPNPIWHTWVDRMHLGLKDKWVDLGICEAILTSKSLAKANPPLIAALTTFWSTTSNTFVFSKGYMSPTLYDVFAMLGLPSDGIAIHHDFEFKYSETVVIDKTEPALAYTRFLAKHRKTGDAIITFEEEVCFYLYWLCKFLINVSSKRIVNYYILIALALANNNKLASGPFFLGIVYRTMYTACNEPKSSTGGPLWFIQLWAYAYFPQLAQKPNLSITEKCASYG
jgi:hypothetical protein